MAPMTKSLAVAAIVFTGFCSAALNRTKDFNFTGVSNRFITPNGDGKNDNVAFTFNNPRDSAGTIQIQDLRGHKVTAIPINPGDTCASNPTVGCEYWDGRAGGVIVPTGVYIYVISIESTIFSGTVVVIR